MGGGGITKIICFPLCQRNILCILQALLCYFLLFVLAYFGMVDMYCHLFILTSHCHMIRRMNLANITTDVYLRRG